MNMRVIFAAAAAWLATACNPIANLEDADDTIATFQARYNEGDAGKLYGLTGDRFKQITSRGEMEDLVTVFSTRLGRIENSERSNFNVSTKNGVTTTVVLMQTDFERGEGVETYTFQGGGDDFELIGWHIASPRLAVTIDDLQPNASGSAESEGAPAR